MSNVRFNKDLFIFILFLKYFYRPRDVTTQHYQPGPYYAMVAHSSLRCRICVNKLVSRLPFYTLARDTPLFYLSLPVSPLAFRLQRFLRSPITEWSIFGRFLLSYFDWFARLKCVERAELHVVFLKKVTVISNNIFKLHFQCNLDRYSSGSRLLE